MTGTDANRGGTGLLYRPAPSRPSLSVEHHDNVFSDPVGFVYEGLAVSASGRQGYDRLVIAGCHSHRLWACGVFGARS